MGEKIPHRNLFLSAGRVKFALPILAALLLLFSVSSTFALVDLSVFGPKRYDRLKGKPTVYIDTFPRCNPSDQAVLKITNGDAKETRIKSAEIFVNGTKVAAESDFKQQVPYFEKQTAVKENNELKVVLKSGMQDDPNSTNLKAQSFLIIEILGKGCDSTPPVLSNPEPTDGSLLNTATPRISVQYADEPSGSGIDTGSARLVLDGTDVTASASVSAGGITYAPSSNLPEGGHTVTADVADRAHNAAGLTWHFATDTIPPAITITSPLEGSFVNTPTIAVSGAVTEINPDSLWINETAVPLVNGSFSLQNVNLTEGADTITVQARDKAGNESTAAVSLTLDTIAPAIQITTPVNGSFVNTPTITVSGTVTEVNPDSLWINGTVVPLVNGAFTLSSMSLTEGSNTITVRARDKAANESTASVTFTLDTVAPVVTISTPVNGLLTRIPNIDLSGTVSEPFTSVTVNGSPALVSGQTYTFTSYALSEGPNALTVSATDRAGNTGTASVSVALDSTPPAAPVITPLPSPSPTPVITVSGTAEAGSTVTLSVQKAGQSPSVIGTATASGQGTFSFGNITLAEGINTFTATAADAAGNISPASAPVSVERDTTPPRITVTTPANNSYTNQTTITVTGSVDEPAELKINGTAVALDGLSFSQTVTLTTGVNIIVISAKDLSGNVATLNWVVYLDQTPPSVTITSPTDGFLTRMPLLTISGTVSEASTTVTINGTAAAVSDKSFTLSNFPLTEGQNTLTATATDRAGNSGTASIGVFLDTQAPSATVTAPSEAAAGTAITISASASDNHGLALSEVLVNGVTIWSSTLNSELSTQNSVQYPVSPDLSQNSVVTIQARATDSAGNIGTATAQVRITSGPTGPGYLEGEVYDDSKGLLLPGATADILDADGHKSTQIVTPEDGSYLAEIPAGSYLAVLSKSGFTPVERSVTVKSEMDSVAIDARLTPINSRQNIIDSAGGTISASPSLTSGTTGTASGSEPGTQSLELSIPSGAVNGQVDLRLTPITNQGLAGLLPKGWSPIAAVDIRAFAEDGTEIAEGVAFGPEGAGLKTPALSALNLAPSSPVNLVRYDTSLHKWTVKNPGAASVDGSAVSASVESTGQYAFVLPDSADITAVVGSPLPGSDPGSLSSAPTATGRVVPPAAPAAAGLKAVGEVVLAPSALGGEGGGEGGIPSGLLITGKVTERFDLLSGEVVLPSDYTQDLVLYRYPCVTNAESAQSGSTLNSELSTPDSGKVGSSFPVTPSHDYTIIDLMKGKVGMEIALKQGAEGTGTMVGTEGARLLDKDGNVLVINQNSLTKTVPVETQTIPASTLTGIVGPDFTLLRAVDVDLSNQTLAGSAELSIPSPANVNSSLPIVVAKAIEIRGAKKLKLVALARLSGSLITSSLNGLNCLNCLNGISTSGQYFFLQAKSALGFVIGTVKDASDKPYPSAQVVTTTCSLTDLTGPDGKYLLASAIAGFTLTASDIYKNDKGTRIDLISAANETKTLDVTINVTPPSVVSVSPAGNATGVDPKTQIVITMSEAVKPETVTSSNVYLEDSTGTRLPGVFSLSPDGMVITFYPGQNLASETAYTLTVGHGVQDLQGYFMGQDYVSHFTIKDTTPPLPPAAGSITATFPDADGYITITATQGSAEATGTVLIINDTSGEIVSVKPALNGSFTGKIMAMLGDEIKIVSMDASGNQTLITYITFKSDDGRYLVTAKGGTVEGEGGLKLEIPEGALLGPTIIKITPITQDQLPVDNPVPSNARFLAGVNIDTGGVKFQKEVQFSVPKPSDMPADITPFIARPATHVYADGSQEKVYVIVDSAKVVNDRLSTACAPFDGITESGIFAFFFDPMNRYPVVFSGYTYQDMDGNPGYNPQFDANHHYLPTSDLPIAGAVIRCVGAENFISYSNSDGHYATYGFTAEDVCRSFATTAIHPQTMNRITVNLVTCDAPYIVNNFNYRLADKDTVIPDKTPPSISMNMQVAPGQGPEYKFVAGTVPVGTEIEIPITVLDQKMGQVSLSVLYQTPVVTTNYSPTITLGGTSLNTFVTPTSPAIYKYTYNANFGSPIAGSSTTNFKPNQEGTYRFNLQATDAAGNNSMQSITVRAVKLGTQSEGLDGAPRVDDIIPANGSEEIVVTMPFSITFSETVQNVNENTLKLEDLGPVDVVTGLTPSTFVPIKIPTSITTTASIDGIRLMATMQPLNNLMFGHKYRITITQGITDVMGNSHDACTAHTPSLPDGCLLPLNQEYSAEFKTKQPQLFDLTGGQFTGGRGVDVYYDKVNDKTYAYVTAGSEGWYVINVTDPTNPTVVKTHKMTTAGVDWIDRSVIVDSDTQTLGITEDIRYSDGNQYGYVRFYGLGTPADPPIIGREKLAEAFTGIPGRLSIMKNFAYVATVGVGVQVVDITAAKDFMQTGKSSDGSTIVGIFDTVGQGYNQPTDIVTYKGNKGILTTTSGHLITLDLSIPQFPQQMAAYKPSTPGPNNFDYDSAWRVAIAPEYAFTDTSQGADMASTKVIDLAITTSMKGRIHTVDMTDPYHPTPLGVTKDDQGNEVFVSAMDIAVNKTSGLVYVTSGNGIYVIDIKDPNNPTLLNIITTTPAQPGSSDLIPLGDSPALAEKDGMVYLANQQKGMRVLSLDLRELGIQPDAEYNAVLIPPTDYYPVLGTKALTIYGIANGVVLDDSWGLYLAAPPINSNVQVGGSVDSQGNLVPLSSGQTLISHFTANQTLKKGLAPLYIRWAGTIDPTTEYFTIKLQARKMSSTSQNETTATKIYDFTFRMRHNGNVLFGDVVSGQAVFVSDSIAGVTPAGTTNDEQKKFDYVQELLNQIIPRARKVWSEPAGTWVPTDTNYTLLEENGIYSESTQSAVRLFRNSFIMAGDSAWRIGDTNVSFDIGSGTASYNDNDNTTDTFRKLMKDYNHRGSVQASKTWVNKIIDKETLVGKDIRIPSQTVNITADNADVLINRAENRHDTGLYELYKNVVERFVNKMIREGERYAGIAHQGVQNEVLPIDNWVSRTGQGTGLHGVPSGMSYSYAGIDSIETYNGIRPLPTFNSNDLRTVSTKQAPAFNTVHTDPSFMNYRGNVDQSILAEPNGHIANTATNRWPGLWSGNPKNNVNEEYEIWVNYFETSACTNPSDPQVFSSLVKDHPYYPLYWSGIDCAAFAQRIINAADPDFNPNNGVPAVKIMVDDLDAYEEKCAIDSHGKVSRNQAARSWVSYFFDYFADDPITYVVNPPQFGPGRVRLMRLMKKGDLIRYGNHHISVVYSDKTTSCGTTQNGHDTCTYEIIHAYGGNTYKYDGRHDDFSRKVTVTRQNIGTPTAFGRIKLWD